MRYFKSDNYGKKLVFGNMIPTHTIEQGNYNEVDAYEVIGNIDVKDGCIIWDIPLRPTDSVYGLGESVRGMNKRGFEYRSFCSDDPNHTPDKQALYGAHNFLIIHGASPVGIYVDFAGEVIFDVDFIKSDFLQIRVSSVDVTFYIFEGSGKEIVKKFRTLIGQSYIPPKWGFGYQQSRWSYETAERVTEIATLFDEYDIPCDAIYLDIDYMERFKDFTIDAKAFPDFEKFVETLYKSGIHLVPIIDAGVKVEPDYEVYEEGIENDYFVKTDEGKPFPAAVWPGKVHFPDFLNPEVESWFGEKYHKLMDLGIEGFWNDMNEPAIFYSEQGLKDAIEFAEQQKGKNLDIYTFFELKDRILNLSNSMTDYKRMYHTYEGKKVNHLDVHNLYGYHMTKAAAKGFESYDSNKRFLMITRASHIGMAKYSGIWTGDNHSWWEHLKLNVQMMPGLNMAGFVYSGADTGGFGGNVSPELLTRWHQFSLFTPLFRNHSAMGTRPQEPWAMDAKTLSLIRDVIRLRYALIPFLYSEFMAAVLENKLLFAPLSFFYSDHYSRSVEDQVMFGDGIMLAPVYTQNARGRMTYCPEDMVLWKAENYESLSKDQLTLLDQGHHYIDLNLSQIPIFIRKNKLIVLVKPKNRVNDLDLAEITVIGFVDTVAEYTLTNDDGFTKAYETLKTKFTVTRKTEGFSIQVDTNDASLGKATFYLIDGDGAVQVTVQEGQDTGISMV
ncbi:glycoside hydrolase family 31 protein [Fusibacter tunisiensis]|uniref:Alpha-glucosidase n=1 Tax=Fusibacter tunisiensis TaxID=1008308 RepID=A0ABS2MQR9_9FIRM|nr:TIM-barrel domain-containing protein [Fusibacter tunisiensis]MBM7561758.1 alpha-glucosidase [Fusibacter tunisiensis]